MVLKGDRFLFVLSIYSTEGQGRDDILRLLLGTEASEDVLSSRFCVHFVYRNFLSFCTMTSVIAIYEVTRGYFYNLLIVGNFWHECNSMYFNKKKKGPVSSHISKVFNYSISVESLVFYLFLFVKLMIH